MTNQDTAVVKLIVRILQAMVTCTAPIVEYVSILVAMGSFYEFRGYSSPPSAIKAFPDIANLANLQRRYRARAAC